MMDMTYITNGARRLMRDWVQHRIADSMRCHRIGTIAGGREVQSTRC
jgi:hypothetical protein